MKLRIMLTALATILATGSLASCGGDAGVTTPAPPPMAVGQSLDTAQVLAQARMTSETSDPYPTNGGALVLNDTSDSSDPIDINGL